MDEQPVSATGAILGFAGDVANVATSISNTNRTIDANIYQSDLAYKRAVEQWHAQNKYNSPEQQMMRLKKAGLNPNLVYGAGTVVGNTQGSRPEYKPPDLQYKYKAPKLDQISLYTDLKAKQAQTNFANANTNNVNQRTETEKYDTERSNLAAQRETIRLEVESATSDAQIKLAQQKLDINTKKMELLEKDIEYRTNEATRSSYLADVALFEKKLAAIGLTRSDPIWMREAAIIWHELKTPEQRRQYLNKIKGQASKIKLEPTLDFFGGMSEQW